MEELPAELTMDILSRLPVKTIIHCKLVCKKWRDLVLDSFFINLHLSRSPTAFIIHRNTPDYRSVSKDPGMLKWVEIQDKVDHHHLNHDPLMTLHLNLTPIFQNSLIHHMGSVNGLICLWQYYPEGNNTYICNPITREYMILPRPQYYKQGFVMIFYGFGVSSVTGEYKVVRIFQEKKIPNGPTVSEAEVYTLGTSQWRSLSPVAYRLNGFTKFYGQFLNNHCHWFASDKYEKICAFDLDKETFQIFPSPPSESVQEDQFHYQSLAVLKGCLCKLEAYGSHFTIWVMKEYGINKSWHKEVVVKKQGVSFDATWVSRQPLYLIEGLKDGIILIVSRNNKLLAYYPESGTIEDTEILDCCITVLTYRPTFLKLQKFDSERVHMF